MAQQANSLTHTKWICKRRIVFASNHRRKIIYNQYRESVGEILRRLCSYKGVDTIEGHLMPDHERLLVSIPPKMNASSFMGVPQGQELAHDLREARLPKCKFGSFGWKAAVCPLLG